MRVESREVETTYPTTSGPESGRTGAKRAGRGKRTKPLDLPAISRQIRGDIVEMSARSGAPHLGSALSCVDILVAAYWLALEIAPDRTSDPTRDRFILSKGHAAAALYATLSRRGFFPHAELATYATPGSRLTEHPSRNCVPGVELGTGSLGHGLPVGVGLSIANRRYKRENRIVVLMSDGECNEGTVWEAALLAASQKLENLVVVIDFNRWQATARSAEVMALQPLSEKWAAFGWCTRDVDGHDLDLLADAMSWRPNQQPLAIVAHTVKGKGVSFMEDDNNWHYRIPTSEEVLLAHRELGLT